MPCLTRSRSKENVYDTAFHVRAHRRQLGGVRASAGGTRAGSGRAGLLVPAARSFWTLLPISLAFGLSVATVTASTAALVSELAQEGAYGAALGTISTIKDIGHASGPVVAGLLIGAFGYAVGFPLIGLGLGLVALLFPLLVRLPHAPSGDFG